MHFSTLLVLFCCLLSCTNAWVKNRWDLASLFDSVKPEHLPCENTNLKNKQQASCCVCSFLVKEIETQLNNTQNDHKIDVVFRLSEDKKTIPYSRSEHRIIEVLDSICSDLALKVTATEDKDATNASKMMQTACVKFVEEFEDELTSVFFNDLSSGLDRMCQGKIGVCKPKTNLEGKSEL